MVRSKLPIIEKGDFVVTRYNSIWYKISEVVDKNFIRMESLNKRNYYCLDQRFIEHHIKKVIKNTKLLKILYE